MMQSARQRLVMTLGASALLHAWLMQAPSGVRVLRTEAARPPISVVLSTPVDWLAPKDVTQHAAVTPVARPLKPVTQAPVAPQDIPVSTVNTTPSSRSESPTPSPASDPTYYPAASLDVYPRAHTALDLGARLSAAQGGEVRATVLIDESGRVNEVREISEVRNPRGQETPTETESAARELLLATRFTPARKDGRVVKAQLRVSLPFGKAAP